MKRKLFFFISLIWLSVLLSGCGSRNIVWKDPAGTRIRISYENGSVLSRRPRFNLSGETVTMQFNGKSWYSVTVVSARAAEQAHVSMHPVAESSNLTVYENEDPVYMDNYNFCTLLLMELPGTDSVLLFRNSEDYHRDDLRSYGSDLNYCIHYYVGNEEVFPDLDTLEEIPD